MLTDAALLVVQESVEDWPVAMLVGDAVNVADGPGWMIVIVTDPSIFNDGERA